jgi:hypothetical protein
VSDALLPVDLELDDVQSGAQHRQARLELVARDEPESKSNK